MIDPSTLNHLIAQAASDGVQQFVVGAVVCRASSVLLLRRPEDDFMGGIFELPSGKVELGESLDAATVREVAEETGLVVTDITHYLGSFDYHSGNGKKSRQFNFVVTVAADDVVKLTEHDAYLWSPMDAEPPVTDAVKQVLGAYRATEIAP